MTDAAPPPDDRAALAAEYALGLLEGDDLQLAARLHRDDAGFRADAERWLARFAPLLDEVAEADLPRDLYPVIAARLDGSAGRGGAQVLQFRRRLRFWQGAAGLSTAAAAGLALLVIARPPAAPFTPQAAPAPAPVPMIAMVEGGANKLVASWNGGERLMVMPAVVESADRAHVHELWIIPADGKPRSMGVMPAGPMRLVVEQGTARMIAEGATLAISVEPAGGSPTGLPTGPVIASGKLERA